jgi:hypothetical protein
MSEYGRGPTVNLRIVQIAQERFGTAEEAREALVRVIRKIPDERLLDARGIDVFLHA